MRPRRLVSVITKEFIQIRRDPRTLAIIILLPIIQLVMFGYAINTVVEHIPLVVLDEARDRLSRDFIQTFVNTGYFDLVGVVDDPLALRAAIDRGEAQAGLHIPPGFARSLAGGEPGQAALLIDGSDPNVAQTALFVSGSIAQAQSLEIAGRGRSFAPPIDLRPQVLYNPSMLSVNTMVPGLIGMIIQFQTLVLTAFAIVRERERGTLEQLIVTPVKPIELLLGKLLPYTVISLFNVTMVILVGVFWFKVELVGSFWLLMALAVVFVVSSLGIGLLLSTVSQTQVQAVQLALFIMLPSILLSGVLFPRETMPAPLHALGYLIPLTYFTRIVRGIYLKGADLTMLWGEVIPLAVLGVAVFTLAVSRFRKTLL
ncbi:MAG: ABC transporter permease [Dehalococcoidia bacterium]